MDRKPRCTEASTEGRRISRAASWRVSDHRLGAGNFVYPQPRRPENRATPWKVARLRACHRFQGAAASNALRTKDTVDEIDRLE